jgi:hypothetical protein
VSAILHHILPQFQSLKAAQSYGFIMLLCVPVGPPISTSEPDNLHIQCETYSTREIPKSRLLISYMADARNFKVAENTLGSLL